MNVFRLKIPKSLLALLGCGLAVLVIGGLIAQGLVRVSWFETTRRKFLLYNGSEVELFGPKKLEQTFTANYPGLAQIDVLIEKNVVEGQPVIFHLRDRCEAESDLVYITASLPLIEDFIFYPFEFAPIDNSTGQSYCLVLEAPEAGAETAVRFRLSTGDLYPYGILKLGIPKVEVDNPLSPSLPDEAANASSSYRIYLPIVIRATDAAKLKEDMGFRLHYRGLLWPTAQVYVSRLTANKPLIWGQPWFYGGLVIVYVVLLAGLFYVARRTVQANGDKQN